ncbi:hypothetical protein GX441_02610 [bacterium]|nr:hypothetical protein [bacterium]
MNEQVRQMVAGFALAYETYKGMLSAEEFRPLESVYKEMMTIAEAASDFMAFNDAATKADIFTRLSAELGKAQALIDSKPKSERRTLSADGFIAQYRILYEQAQSTPHAYRTREVYEKLLALGEGAQTPLDVVAKAERDNLFHKIGAMGVFDTYKLDYDKTDPNETILRDFRKDVIRIAEESNTADELTYKVDKRMYESQKEIAHDNFITQMIANLVDSFLNLELSKAAVRIGKNEYIVAVAIYREEAREAYRILKDEFGLDWDKFISTERYRKRFLMQSAVLAETVRVFQAMAPENLEWMRETLFEEILSPLSLADIILRKPAKVFHPLAMEEHSRKHGIDAKLKSRAQELLKDFYWAK